jgi:salicylate hydroxylase
MRSGVGEKARGRAGLHRLHGDARRDRRDARSAAFPTGEAFRQRFGNPYAGDPPRRRAPARCWKARRSGRQSSFHDQHARRCASSRTSARAVTAIDQQRPRAATRAWHSIGADGGKSVVRAQYVNDPPRVTGHVVYRAVVDKADFPGGPALERGQPLGRCPSATWCTTRCAAASSTTWS